MSKPRANPRPPVPSPLTGGALLLLLVAGCRPGAPVTPRGPTPDVHDWRGLAWLPDQTLERRRQALERRLVRHGPDAPGVAEQRHRLAALYLALRHRLRRAALRDELRLAQVRRHLGAEAIALLTRERRRLRDRAHGWLKRAAEQWRALLDTDTHRHYRLRDEVLYEAWSVTDGLARAARRAGRTGRANALEAAAQRRLVQLLREHPRSKRVGEALLARGEYLRRLRRFGAAIDVYRKVLRAPGRGLRPSARLGLGRCLDGANQPQAALSWLGRAVSTARRADVRDRARRALFEVWSRVGRASEAYPLFEGLARGRKGFARELLLALAAWCRDNGRASLANALYREALRRWPRARARCQWWVAVSSSASVLHDWATVHRGLAELPGLRAGLRVGPGTAASVVRDCDRSVEVHLRQLASQLHARGMQAWDLAMLGTGRRAYEAYLRAFPRAKHHYLMAFQHAELLWLMVRRKLGVADLSWERVAEAFERVSRLPRPPHLARKEYRSKREEAALAAVRSLMNAAQLERWRMTALPPRPGTGPCVRLRGQRCPPRPSTKPWPIPALERRLLRAFEWYLRFVPKSPYRGAIRFNSAYLYWRRNHLTVALPLFLQVALQHQVDMPGAARAAAVHVLYLLRRLGRPRAYRRYLSEFLAAPRLVDDWSVRRTLERLHYELLRDDAERHRKRGQWARCGGIYARLGALYHAGGRHTARDLWRGAECLRRAHLLTPALAQYRLVVARGYGSKHRPLAMVRAGRLLERLTFHQRAAGWYERFGERYPDHRLAPSSVLRALRLHALLRQRFAARNLLQDIRLRYTDRRPAVVAEATWIVLSTPWDVLHERKQPALLARYLKEHGKAAAPDRILEALVRLAEVLWRRSCPVTPTAGSCLTARRTGPGGRATPARRVRRRAALVKRAQGYLSRALKLWEGAGRRVKVPRAAADRAERLRGARLRVVRARYLLAEIRRERQAPLGLPNRLRAGPRSLRAWLQRQQKTLRQRNAPYRALLPGSAERPVAGATWGVAAAYRLAAPYLALARRLDAWKPARAQASRPAFRAALQAVRTTLRAQARAGFRRCVALATRLQVAGAWARRCHRGLAQALGRRPPSTRARYRRQTPPRFRLRPATFQPRRPR